MESCVYYIVVVHCSVKITGLLPENVDYTPDIKPADVTISGKNTVALCRFNTSGHQSNCSMYKMPFVH